jgi:hypothetical protein
MTSSPPTDLDGGAGSGGATPGSGGAANAGSGGGAGTQPLSCAGAWGTSSRELLRGGSGVQLMSPTLSPDELELFYSTIDDLDVVNFRRSVRSSKAAVFPEGTPVPELDAACPSPNGDRHMDLSADGLRAYFVCSAEPILTSGPLRVARRSSIGGAFTVDTKSYGTVGPSVSIAKDELVAYSTTLTRPGPPLMFTRTDTSSTFAPGISIPGLEAADFSALDPSPDGLSLYGGLDSSVQVASRAAVTGDYGAPTTVIAAPMDRAVGAPEVSQDCRSLYYIDVDTAQSPSVYALLVRTR